MDKRFFTLSFFNRAFIVFVLGISFSEVKSQEILVNNGSFEDNNFCPHSMNRQNLTSLLEWRQGTEGTPDHFGACSDKMGVPKNQFGYQAAQQGEGYVGIVTYTPSKRDYREYLSAKLTRPLNAGEMVCVSFYVSPADKGMYVNDGAGAYFSKRMPTAQRDGCIDATPQVANPRLNVLSDPSGWQLISDVFVAEGGEKFLTIGNFKKDRKMTVLKQNPENGADESNDWAYLYFDNLEVKSVSEKSECSCANELIAATVHDPPLELEDIREISKEILYFDFDADEITSESKTILSEVAKKMVRDRTFYLEVNGHTDIVGRAGYNVELSERRAQQVIDFLVGKGINTSRLTIAYHGSELPAQENATAEGRAKNRRVEFRVLQHKFELVED